MDGSNTVGWWEFVSAWKDNEFFVRLATSERIFLTIDDAQSCLGARVISIFMMSVIMVASVCFMLSTMFYFRDPP